MKNQTFSRLIGAALLTLTACNDGGPTAPTEPIPTDALVGEWHGTMSYPTGECGPEEVGVTARMEDERVRFDVQSGCYGFGVTFRLASQAFHAVRGDAALQLRWCTTVLGVIHDPLLTARVSGTLDQGRLRLDTQSFRPEQVWASECSRPGATLDLVR